jgi:putative hemolysin
LGNEIDFHFPGDLVKRSLVALMLMICIVFAIAVFLPAIRPVHAGSDKNASVSANFEDGTDITKAADYCVKKGGEVDAREPYFNTNDDEQNWFRLAGSRSFCKFTLKKDGSRIHVLLSTLYSEQPTLAALAYYAEVPFSGTCNGNPASCYCSQLGGTDLFGGINENGGGWVMKSDPIDTTLEACIFPDMSTIDSWGLAYRQYGIIRGKDLEKVLRYANPYADKKK